MPPLSECVFDAVEKIRNFLDLYDLIVEEFSVVPEDQYDSETRAKMLSVPQECQKSMERLCWYIRSMATGEKDPGTVISTDLRIALAHLVTVEDTMRDFQWKADNFLRGFWDFKDAHDTTTLLPDSMYKEDEEVSNLLAKLKLELLQFLALTLYLEQ